VHKVDPKIDRRDETGSDPVPARRTPIVAVIREFQT
jgi:hypothetical protein